MQRLVVLLLVLGTLGCSACGALPGGMMANLSPVPEHDEVAMRQDDTPPAVVPAMVAAADADGDGIADAMDTCPGTASGVRVDSQGCAVLCNLQLSLPFASNQDAISQERAARLERLAQLLRDNPGLTAVLAGHTDNVGGKEANQALSQRRAQHVHALLTQQYGVKPSRLQMEAHGDTRPMVSNNTDAGRARNRRVDILVVGAYEHTGNWLALSKPYHFQFDANANAISDPLRAKLDSLGQHLQDNPGLHASIEGHSDSTGNRHHNLALSKERARAVEQYLADQWQIEPSRLQAAGLGDASPIANNDTARGRALNRRVSIRLSQSAAPSHFLAKARDEQANPTDHTAALRERTVPHVALQAQAALEFDADAATITPEVQRKLESIGAMLSDRDDLRIIVQGYSDASGDAQHDHALSQQRAEAVKSLLVERFQLAPERVATKGYGSDLPIASNATEAGRQRNRRVVLRILTAE